MGTRLWKWAGTEGSEVGRTTAWFRHRHTLIRTGLWGQAAHGTQPHSLAAGEVGRDENWVFSFLPVDGGPRLTSRLLCVVEDSPAQGGIVFRCRLKYGSSLASLRRLRSPKVDIDVDI